MSSIQFARFVDQASQLDALHRITKLDITAPTQGMSFRESTGGTSNGISTDEKKQVELTAELITMDGAGGITKLAMTESEDSFASVLRDRPLFSRYVPAAPPKAAVVAAPKPPTNPKPTATKAVAIVKPAAEPNFLERLQYVASFSSRGVWQAWLYDTKSNEQYAVVENDLLRSGDFAIRIVTIEADYLEIEGENDHAAVERIELGDKLL